MQIIRDAYKATIRGNLIAMNLAKRKKEKAKVQEIQEKLKKKNKKKSREENFLREIRQLKQNFDNKISNEIYWNL